LDEPFQVVSLLNRFIERRLHVFELFIAGDAVRRRTQESFEPKAAHLTKAKQERPRRARVRSTSAAALRSLAERLEPSLS